MDDLEARRAEKEEWELLVAKLEQERERCRQERESDDILQEEANRLREGWGSHRNTPPRSHMLLVWQTIPESPVAWRHL